MTSLNSYSSVIRVGTVIFAIIAVITGIVCAAVLENCLVFLYCAICAADICVPAFAALLDATAYQLREVKSMRTTLERLQMLVDRGEKAESAAKKDLAVTPKIISEDCIFCPLCGQKQPLGRTNCSNCSAAFDAAVPSPVANTPQPHAGVTAVLTPKPAEAPRKPNPVTPKKVAEGWIVCPDCGERQRSNRTLCLNCSTPFRQE